MALIPSEALVLSLSLDSRGNLVFSGTELDQAVKVAVPDSFTSNYEAVIITSQEQSSHKSSIKYESSFKCFLLPAMLRNQVPYLPNKKDEQHEEGRLVLLSPAVLSLRRKNGLPPRNFVINIKDESDNNERFPLQVSVVPDSFSKVSLPTVDALILTQLAFTNHATESHSFARFGAITACRRFPNSSRGWLRLGTISEQSGYGKLAMTCFAKALDIALRVQIGDLEVLQEPGQEDEAATEKTIEFLISRILALNSGTTFLGPLVHPDEKGQFDIIDEKSKTGDFPSNADSSGSHIESFPPGFIDQLLRSAWSERVREVLSQTLEKRSMGENHMDEPSNFARASIETRTRFVVPIIPPTGTKQLTQSLLPRFFSPLVPFYLFVSSTPVSSEHVSSLSTPSPLGLGIRHIVTLTEEEPLPEDWFDDLDPRIDNSNGQNDDIDRSRRRITHTHLPVPNTRAPSLEQVDIFLRLCCSPSLTPLLVHCGGGKGRAGTFAACYLVAFGFRRPPIPVDGSEERYAPMSASQAIQLLRRMRPGSLETQEQEAFVSKFESAMWKRRTVFIARAEEPPPTSFRITMKSGGREKDGSAFKLRDADLILQVGLPGSGKSHWRRSLQARIPNLIVLSGDDEKAEQSRNTSSSLESSLGKISAPSRSSRNLKVVIDRCNATSAERKRWLSLATNFANPICIYFDFSREVCASRAQSRPSHPTLPPGNRVTTALSHFSKILEAPSEDEGFLALVTVDSIQASNDLVREIAPEIGLLKFPKTAHLINLGAMGEDDFMGDWEAWEKKVEMGDGDVEVVITEKVDGANIGFSLSSTRSLVVQNRSHYITPGPKGSHPQFTKLAHWIQTHYRILQHILDRDPLFPERYILYGEWLVARHSIKYEDLPDWFLAFDLFDRKERTWATRGMLEKLIESAPQSKTTVGTNSESPPPLHLVPILSRGSKLPSKEDLIRMVQQMTSKFYRGFIEGVYVKLEGKRKGSGTTRITMDRGKVVRDDFLAGNENWSRRRVMEENMMTVAQ